MTTMRWRRLLMLYLDRKASRLSRRYSSISTVAAVAVVDVAGDLVH